MQDNLFQLEYFQKLLLNRNYSPKTLEIYSNCLKYFFHIVKKDDKLITDNDVLEFLLGLRSQNYQSLQRIYQNLFFYDS